MGSALKMTPEVSTLGPEALAFIKSGVPAKDAKPVVNAVKELARAKEVSAPTETPPPEQPVEAREVKPKRAVKPQAAPQYLNHRITISVTTRLEQRTADALRRAHLEQKLRNVRPATQQEIIELAVQAWLKENGFLE